MNARARVRLKFPNKEQLLAIFAALQVETRSPVTGRSKVEIAKEDKTLTLTVIFTAKDTSALRAAMNSYLHWVRLTKDVLASVGAP
jgi:tRNA threonylcarbamoyladenosine modification (KEOPS) complex  Pcc1 subunit